jgi:hypothetical protein
VALREARRGYAQFSEDSRRVAVRLRCEGDAYLELACLSLAHDVLLVVTVDVPGFRASCDSWVLAGAWRTFVGELQALERTRRGSARLESISPGELGLEIYATDALGHMAVRGELEHDGAAARARFEFSGLSFDPGLLAAFVAEVEALQAATRAPSERAGEDAGPTRRGGEADS